MLGLDSVKDALPIKRRIGFVADGQMMYEWMSVREAIWFCKGFYPGWDDAFAASLLETAGTAGTRQSATLSRGEQAKLALLLAMAYHPELLILDEPTTGLDVVVRRDFLQGIIELIQEAGRTVFYSTHIVHEVERVADWVGIIDAGRLVCCTPLQTLKASIKRLILTFDEAARSRSPASPTGSAVTVRAASVRSSCATSTSRPSPRWRRCGHSMSKWKTSGWKTSSSRLSATRRKRNLSSPGTPISRLAVLRR